MCVCGGGGVKGSHLCHNEICVNIEHQHVDFHSVNFKRKNHCKLRGQCANFIFHSLFHVNN